MDSFYFYGSKLAWILFNPINLIFFTLAFGVYLLWTRKHVWGRFLLSATIVFVGLIGILPVDQWIMRPLEDAYTQPDLSKYPKIDGLIVLGGELDTRLSANRRMPITTGGGERLNALIKLMGRFPDATAVFSGGSGELTPSDTEALFSKIYLEELGINTEKIIFEDVSRNTRENALKLKEKLQPQPGQNWVLITSAFHMGRSMKEFAKGGWTPIPYPVGYRTESETRYFTGNIRLKLMNLITGTREWLAGLRP